MKKLMLIFLVGILLCIQSVHAQNTSDFLQYNMVITKSNQSIIKIPLDENTKINIGNRNKNHEQFTISFSTGKNHYEFMVTDVTGLKYDQTNPAGVIQITESNDSWRIERDLIIFDVFTKGSSMSLFDINGNEYIQQNLTPGITTVSIEFLPAGVYILQFNHSSTKFLKK